MSRLNHWLTAALLWFCTIAWMSMVAVVGIGIVMSIAKLLGV